MSNVYSIIIGQMNHFQMTIIYLTLKKLLQTLDEVGWETLIILYFIIA